MLDIDVFTCQEGFSPFQKRSQFVIDSGYSRGAKVGKLIVLSTYFDGNTWYERYPATFQKFISDSVRTWAVGTDIFRLWLPLSMGSKRNLIV
jgi:hypothetical protein